MIQLFKDLSEQDTLPAGVGLMLVSDEEIGGKNGTRYQLQEQNITCDFFVAGEPTNLEICTELKGLLHIQITQKGKAAHGSKPWEGKNANIALAEKIAAFYKTNRELTENIWETTYNLSLLKGGKAENVVSDEATAYFDIRRIEQDTAEKIIERLKAFFPDTTLSVVRNEIPLKTSAEDKHIALLKRLIENETKKETKIIKETYAADGRYYSGAGTPSINFGLVGGGMHADDEWIDLKSIPVYYEILKAFLLSV